MDEFNFSDLNLVSEHLIKEAIKKQKEIEPERVLPPTILVERDGDLDIVACCPTADKNLSLQSMIILKNASDPDAVSFVVEAVMAITENKSATDYDEIKAEARTKYPNGLEKAQKENPDDDNLIEALVCIRVDRECNTHNLIVIPFKSRDGKIEWLEDCLPGDQPNRASGPILQQMIKMMSSSNQELFNTLNEKGKELGLSPEQIRFHGARGAMAFLMQNNFFVLDLMSRRKVEWTNAPNIAKNIVLGMIENNFLVGYCEDEVLNFVNDNLSNPEFSEIFADYLNTNNFLGQKFEDFEFDEEQEEKIDVIKFMGLAIEEACLSPLNIEEIIKKLSVKIKSLDKIIEKEPKKEGNFGNWNDFFGNS